MVCLLESNWVPTRVITWDIKLPTLSWEVGIDQDLGK